MVTMAQRIEQLRIGCNLSRSAFSAALGFPKTAAEKFETGRQTPSQEQQEKMAAYFGVSLSHLRGETNDLAQAEDWMDGAFLDVEPIATPVLPKIQKAAPASGEDGMMVHAFLRSKKFQESLHTAVLEVLRSPEGQEILTQVLRKELSHKA